jgi:hypothetical protein
MKIRTTLVVDPDGYGDNEALISMLPPYAYQITTEHFGYVWQSRFYLGRVKYTISKNQWYQLVSLITLPAAPNGLIVLGDQTKIVKLRKDVEVLVSFTLNRPVDVGGSIQIKFPADYPSIYPHCRSSITVGSLLYAEQANPAGPVSGTLGCYIQKNGASYSWIITGFKKITDAMLPFYVRIYGRIDLPSISGIINALSIST